jgi:signal transduction histidine kinase
MGEVYPATFVPDVADNGTIAAVVALEGAPWFVEVDATAAIAQAEEQGKGVLSGFRRTFLWVSLAAVLAGLSLVGIVWQSERLARQRSRFAASAAHELRTPLAGLRVYADMLSEQLGDPERSRQYARHVASEAERLGRVVSNVLEYSQLERGVLKVRPEPGDLGLAVRECVDTLEAALISAGVMVEVRVDPGLPPVPFDRDAIFHIVQNLLDNAEKYTRQVDDRRIEVGLAREGDRAVLTVTDHGPGLSEEARRHIFQPFTRAEQPDAPPGLGLGLTLVRALADAHRAEVSYGDAPGGGAAFVVAFPLGAQA